MNTEYHLKLNFKSINHQSNWTKVLNKKCLIFITLHKVNPTLTSWFFLYFHSLRLVNRIIEMVSFELGKK